MNFMSWPYPRGPKQGLWGESTSLENFCEKDYEITSLVVEFVNTLTNLAYLFYAYHGVQKSRLYADFWSRAFPYFALACLGFGSAAFHGTMKMEAQWSDDLSMTLATGIIFYRVMSFGRSSKSKRKFAYLLTLLLSAIAIYHCLVVEVLVHQGSFVLMVVIVAFRTANLIKTRIKDEQVKERMNRIARSGSVLFFVAWVLWNVDNIFCSTLRSVRESIGIPWGFLFELHGWWHVLTAVSVYFYFVLIEHLTAEVPVEESIEASGVYAWPVVLRLKGQKSASTATQK